MPLRDDPEGGIDFGVTVGLPLDCLGLRHCEVLSGDVQAAGSEAQRRGLSWS